MDLAAGPGRESRRGSEWRRWDLHVHTPFSVLSNGFGDNFDQYAKALFEAAVAAEIYAIGVTDYFLVEGYRELRLLVEDGPRLDNLLGPEKADLARKILLIPNIELRTTPVITDADGHASRVNLHVLFSEEVPVGSIQEDFLRLLRFTSESGPGRPDESNALTRANLEALGHRLKDQHQPFREHSDVYVGMMNAVVSHEEVTRVLEEQSRRFRDKYLLVLPSDEDLSRLNWGDQAHLTRKVLIQKSHMLFSSNSGTREFGLGRRHPSVDAFKAEFQSRKPCVHGSDAHDYASLFRPTGGRQLWVKGDLTFRGLRQLLAEPETRVFIGALPPALDRLHRHRTKILRAVDIHKKSGSTLTESWFDTKIELNPELVAIIGKKGSGKSALADVLGLLGNTPRYEAFSFLSGKNFRNPRGGKAHHFEASMEWADGSQEGPRTLDRNPDRAAVEKVKYLPQSYLEEICTEVGAGTSSRFYAELQQAIFSHVPEAERLGIASLDELLATLGHEIGRSISQRRESLRGVNAEIVALEAKLDPEHRRGIEQQLEERRRELSAHDEAAPPDVAAPSDDAAVREESTRAAEELARVAAERTAVESRLSSLRDEDISLARREAQAIGLIDRMRNLRHLVENEMAAAERDFADVAVQASEVAGFTLDLAPLEGAVARFRARRSEISSLLDSGVDGSPAHSLAGLATRVEALTSQLSEPERRYQAYLAARSEWDAVRATIVGTADAPGTILFLESQIRGLDEVPASLEAEKSRRRQLSVEIHEDKQRLRGHYERYYGPVEQFLSGHPVAASEGFRLAFDASIAEEGFSERFLALVHQGRIGPFSGVEEGRKHLAERLENVDWSSSEEVVVFAESLLAAMATAQGKPVSLASQLRQGATVQELDDLVFGLDYLSPIYELTWDGRRVDELSPGERGNLLLIFYLLIDQSDIPIVLDQPEENLDNQTIVGTLVPCMRDAKQRRQVIMVTHNPNLAVVCDADQVVSAEIDKAAGNRVTYHSGSIEDPATNQRIVDILEGTRPAFDQREARYGTSPPVAIPPS